MPNITEMLDNNTYVGPIPIISSHDQSVTLMYAKSFGKQHDLAFSMCVKHDTSYYLANTPEKFISSCYAIISDNFWLYETDGTDSDVLQIKELVANKQTPKGARTIFNFLMRRSRNGYEYENFSIIWLK